MVFTRFSGRTNSRTHSLTDGQIRMQYASGTVFQRCQKHKMIKWAQNYLALLFFFDDLMANIFVTKRETDNRRLRWKLRVSCTLSKFHDLGPQTAKTKTLIYPPSVNAALAFFVSIRPRRSPNASEPNFARCYKLIRRRKCCKNLGSSKNLG